MQHGGFRRYRLQYFYLHITEQAWVVKGHPSLGITFALYNLIPEVSRHDKQCEFVFM